MLLAPGQISRKYGFLCFYYSTIAPFYDKRAKERAKYATLLHCRTGQKYGRTNLRNTDPNLVEEINSQNICVLYVKPLNKVYLLTALGAQGIVLKCTATVLFSYGGISPINYYFNASKLL